MVHVVILTHNFDFHVVAGVRRSVDGAKSLADQHRWECRDIKWMDLGREWDGGWCEPHDASTKAEGHPVWRRSLSHGDGWGSEYSIHVLALPPEDENQKWEDETMQALADANNERPLLSDDEGSHP